MNSLNTAPRPDYRTPNPSWGKVKRQTHLPTLDVLGMEKVNVYMVTDGSFQEDNRCNPLFQRV